MSFLLQTSLRKASTTSCYHVQKRAFFNWFLQSGLTGRVKQPNQTFLAARDEDELATTLLGSSKTPLILNFTTRDNVTCNKITGALTRIVLLETEKSINLVDIEMEWFENRNLPMKYNVFKIPTLVAIRNTFPVDQYIPNNLDNKEVNWIDLKEWVEKNAA